MGPTLPTEDVYLRTAVNVGREGWAHFGHVPMQDYRWGIFLAERDPDRRIAFGEHKGEPAWQKVPGEYRADLQRLIVIQGDTEPASVEQQRNLGATAPSLYDLRNLFQVNVEEGRHLWAMVYLLHAYFGREGREEAEELLHRNSGSEDSPRILGAFNEETPDWLSFFMFTYFTDRDGKYQLGTLKESAFDPLSPHLRVHAQGGGAPHDRRHHRRRPGGGAHRRADARARHRRRRPRYGGIPLDVIQKYLNFHYSVSLDLFGGETSTNVANYFTAGLKGRWLEERRKDDHLLTDDAIMVDALVDGEIGADRGVRAGRAQHRPAPRVHRRLPERHQAVEPDPRRGRACRSGCTCRTSRSTGRSARSPAIEATPAGELLSAERVGAAQGTMAAHRRRQDPRALADAAGVRARQDRGLDRAAAQRASTASRSTTTTCTSPRPATAPRGRAMTQLFNACEYLLDRRLDGRRRRRGSR